MKKTDELKELRDLPVADLNKRARSMGEELMKLRFRNATGQYGDAHRFTQLRRGIARIGTIIKEKLTTEKAGKSKKAA
jgi:large subunit ribosomal protein L29